MTLIVVIVSISVRVKFMMSVTNPLIDVSAGKFIAGTSLRKRLCVRYISKECTPAHFMNLSELALLQIFVNKPIVAMQPKIEVIKRSIAILILSSPPKKSRRLIEASHSPRDAIII